MTTEEYISINLSNLEIIDTWNEYCMQNRYEEDIIFNMVDFTTICGNNFMKIFPKLDRQFSLSHPYFRYDTTITSYDTAADAIASVVDMYALAKFVEEYHEELLED